VLTDKGLGWHLTCKECPLLPHLKALKEEPRDCVGGIMTNAQGAVVLGQCEYYVLDSFKVGKFECTHGEVKVPDTKAF
jgi:hypothetical protein